MKDKARTRGITGWVRDLSNGRLETAFEGEMGLCGNHSPPDGEGPQVRAALICRLQASCSTPSGMKVDRAGGVNLTKGRRSHPLTEGVFPLCRASPAGINTIGEPKRNV
ncbi:MAG: hypothetical protein LLF90_03715 [Methanomicrobiaceae archaeon]|nr:hypothetical protein [Methanomicrobiaceae archaeon]